MSRVDHCLAVPAQRRPCHGYAKDDRGVSVSMDKLEGRSVASSLPETTTTSSSCFPKSAPGSATVRLPARPPRPDSQSVSEPTSSRVWPASAGASVRANSSSVCAVSISSWSRSGDASRLPVTADSERTKSAPALYRPNGVVFVTASDRFAVGRELIAYERRNESRLGSPCSWPPGRTSILARRTYRSETAGRSLRVVWFVLSNPVCLVRQAGNAVLGSGTSLDP
ncbi:hypothetical protein SAMN05443661_12425 [Natronobacterium gregoryi]|uniref:Uncharacterized protein n=1 Tax=Natronobacterium gregoryi TaxID=44930 RepID=A0A1I3QQ35_9EURY|nr:hypothetical protein SAMN05443661_12425 [Natronobacterium gregoryi]